MASSSNSRVKEVQQQVEDVKAVMCAAAPMMTTCAAHVGCVPSTDAALMLT